MFKGANSLKEQEERSFLIRFLKGSKKQKELLKLEKPDLFSYFDKVWTLRTNHMIKNVPPQYVFCHVCCLKIDCCHPICKSQSIINLPSWYTGRPPVNYIPLPIPDPSRPWGNQNCDKCTGPCYGHFLKPDDALKSVLPPMARPPSQIIKEAFEGLPGYPPSEQLCAKQTLLSPDGVLQWMNHLHMVKENRRRGAAQAALTRRQKKAATDKPKQWDSSYYCGVCHSPYQEFTNSIEQWIGCDICDSWYHFVCVGIDPLTVPDQFKCEDCSFHT